MVSVGREAELAELRVWWSRAARGRGGLALVGGEAGIGKTRLAEELARLVEAQGGRVLRGATMFTEPVPYQAIVDALRSALPLVAGLEIRPIWLAAVAPLLVDLKARRPDLPALAPLDPGRERARLFEGLARCFEELAHPRPLLLILEDLHWAGAATAACIEFLARRAGDHALLILGTYREEETPRAHPFRELLRRMRAERLVNHLALSRLPPSAVAALVEQTPGLDTSMGELAQRLYVESEGHPLFLNALISEQLEMGAVGNNGRARAVGSDHAPLFGRVRALITDHLARLSPSAQALAEVAAAVGPAFDIDLVGEIGGWGEGAALHGLDELLDQHLVHEVGGPGRYEYAFAHHLIQETIYAGIPAGTLQRRHRRIGRVIEQLYPTRLDDLAGALALHFDRGCEPERAAPYYLRAARRALAVYADQEAQADAVPDPESRATFMELPFNSEILAAYGSDMWPGNAPC